MQLRDAPGAPAKLSVSLRIRPPLAHELSAGENSVFSVEPGSKVLAVERDDQTHCVFNFDHVFGPSHSQEAVYEASVAQHVSAWLEGRDAAILAFGQTGAGKTHSIGTGFKLAFAEGAPPAQQGVVDRCIRALFAHIAAQRAMPGTRACSARVQVLEVVSDQVLDLLSCAIGRRVDGGRAPQPRSLYLVPSQDHSGYSAEPESAAVEKEVELRKFIQVCPAASPAASNLSLYSAQLYAQ